ncbi:MAG: hypothetical protein NDP22_05090, partial [Crenarchaeota archaeon]|nr:hypothetical protein [Thermoproteota archaeon]
MIAVKLFEYNVPGEIVGKEVIDKNSALVGVCLGMFLDLRTKTVYLIVGGKDYMLKVPMNAVVDVNKE